MRPLNAEEPEPEEAVAEQPEGEAAESEPEKAEANGEAADAADVETDAEKSEAEAAEETAESADDKAARQRRPGVDRLELKLVDVAVDKAESQVAPIIAAAPHRLAC